MVSQQLIDKVRYYLSQGYDINYVRRFFFYQHVPPAEIEEAIKIATSKQTKSLIGKKKLIFISITIVLIIGVILGFIFLFVNRPPTQTQPMAVSITGLPPEIAKGFDLQATAEVSYLPQNAAGEIKITQEISDSKGNPYSQLTKSENFNVSDGPDFVSSLSISALAIGNYKIKTTVLYNGQIAETINSFQIIDNSTLSDNSTNQNTNGNYNGNTNGNTNQQSSLSCTNSCNDNNVCTSDSCVSGICKFQPISPCCGDYICDSGETASSCPTDCGSTTSVNVGNKSDTDLIDQAETVADTNPSQAAQICVSVSAADNKDICYSIVAQVTFQSALCAQINLENKRDNCYLYIASQKKTDLCDKIVDAVKQASCQASITDLTAISNAYNGTDTSSSY